MGVEKIGWTVTDPEGNVVESGEVAIAELTVEAREALGLPAGEGN